MGGPITWSAFAYKYTPSQLPDSALKHELRPKVCHFTPQSFELTGGVTINCLLIPTFDNKIAKQLFWSVALTAMISGAQEAQYA